MRKSADAAQLAAADLIRESYQMRTKTVAERLPHHALLAADAYSDATLIGDKVRLPDATEWAARARELYERASAVPVLEALRSRVR